MENTETTEVAGLNVYEVGYLLLPSIAEEQVAGEVQAIKSTIEKYNSSFISEEFPELRPLAYTMAKSANGALKQKFDRAYFGWIKFETTAEAAKNIKTDLDKNPLILRSLLITTVRENTMISQKVMFKGTVDSDTSDKPLKNAGVASNGEAVPINEEELDKTLENLVVE